MNHCMHSSNLGKDVTMDVGRTDRDRNVDNPRDFDLYPKTSAKWVGFRYLLTRRGYICVILVDCEAC
jgi:hypothetical protein